MSVIGLVIAITKLMEGVPYTPAPPLKKNC